jgi:predicted nucleic acid-binding protein
MSSSVPEYLVDTSVVVKWVVERDEADVVHARQLLLAHGRNDCSLTVPELLFVEFANALTVGHRKEAPRVRQAIRFLRDLGLKIVSLQWEALDRAIDLADSKRVAVYDSYFLTLAEHLGILLVTADEKFLRRISPHPSVLALRDVRLPVDSQ